MSHPEQRRGLTGHAPFASLRVTPVVTPARLARLTAAQFTAQEDRDHSSLRAHRSRRPRVSRRRDRRGRRPRGVLRRPGGSRRRRHRRARGGAGHGGHGARAARRGPARGDAAAQPPERPPGSLGGRSQRGGPAARWRRRLRDHQQRGHRALRRGRGPARPAGGADRPVRRGRHAGRGRPGRRASSASTRTAGASATWRRYIADGYNDGGVQLLEAGTGVGKSFAYLVPALALGARQRRAHGRQHQHHQPAGAAGRQGPAAAPARAGRRRVHAHVRPAQGLAELSLPVAHAPGGGVPADPARAGQARRAARHRRVGRPHRRRHPERPAGHALAPRCGTRSAPSRPVHPAQVHPLRPVLPVPRPPPRGRGRRGGGQPSPAGGRPVACGRRRTTGRRRRCCRPTAG